MPEGQGGVCVVGDMSDVLLLTRRDIRPLLSMDACMREVERGFGLLARGQSLGPAAMHVDAERGEFHIKGGGLCMERTYFALKANGGFFENRARFNLPNIQGVIILFDGRNGRPLAIMDSIDITVLRTGATTGVAMRHLADPQTRVATLCGAGTQAGVHLEAMARTLPHLERVQVWSRTPQASEQFAQRCGEGRGFELRATTDLPAAVRASGVVITCTPARHAFLRAGDVRPGTMVAAVGADSPDKQELEPALTAASRLVTDITAQCARVGELHHAIKAGLATITTPYAELGQIIAGEVAGGHDPTRVTVFDSTGTAIQDAAAAAMVYQRAIDAGVGQTIRLGEA